MLVESALAIPIALYRPHSGLRARNGKKMAETWENGHFDPFLGKISYFSAVFPPFPGRAKIHFSHFGPEARNGVCTGQSGLQIYTVQMDAESLGRELMLLTRDLQKTAHNHTVG